MADLILFTYQYPYDRGETFIENEISFAAEHFDRVICVPCGIKTDSSICRDIPSNVIALKPACTRDLFFRSKAKSRKAVWNMLNMFPWLCACLASKHFYKEIRYLISDIGFSFSILSGLFEMLAPALRNRFHFRKQLSEFHIRKAYCYSYWLDPTILFANKLLTGSEIVKKISRVHGRDLYAYRNPHNYLPFQKQSIEYLDRIFAISNDGFQYLSKAYPMLANKISVSHLGTKDYGLTPTDDKKTSEKNKFRIVSCSNIIPLKRIDLIIDALRKLPPSVKDNTEWVHFGGGESEMYIRQYAEDSLQDVHHEFKGIVPNAEVLRYYSEYHTDLFINVSSTEGLPVSIMEAASFGIPVIATDVGGTAEIVFNGENGYLLDKYFKPEQLAGFITELYKTPASLTAFAERSRSIWESSYDSVANYTAFYNEIAKHNTK